jgi:hypothetical protein
MWIGAATMALGCTLCVGLGAQPAEAHSPKGKAYHITVYTSFETQFDDCFAFLKDGTLVIEGFGPLLYRFDELNGQPEAWQAISTQAGGFNLAFHGTIGGADARTISANGIGTDGDTYILQGVLDPSCAAERARRAGGVPYRR